MGGNKHRIRSLKTRFFLGSLSFHLPPISLTLFHLFLLPTFLSLLTTLSKFQSPQPKSFFFFFFSKCRPTGLCSWNGIQTRIPKPLPQNRKQSPSWNPAQKAMRYMHIDTSYIHDTCMCIKHSSNPDAFSYFMPLAAAWKKMFLQSMRDKLSATFV